jgi:hypothetical protein
VYRSPHCTRLVGAATRWSRRGAFTTAVSLRIATGHPGKAIEWSLTVFVALRGTPKCLPLDAYDTKHSSIAVMRIANDRSSRV